MIFTIYFRLLFQKCVPFLFYCPNKNKQHRANLLSLYFCKIAYTINGKYNPETKAISDPQNHGISVTDKSTCWERV